MAGVLLYLWLRDSVLSRGDAAGAAGAVDVKVGIFVILLLRFPRICTGYGWPWESNPGSDNCHYYVSRQGLRPT